MQAAMDGRGFRTFMETFLRYADNGLGRVFNLAWAFVPVVESIVALVLLWDDPGSTSFILTAIGLGIVLVGIWLVSNVWKTPTYKMILALDPEAISPDWEAVRQRYFTINWLQLVTTWGAFALFLVALIFLQPARSPSAAVVPLALFIIVVGVVVGISLATLQTRDNSPGTQRHTLASEDAFAGEGLANIRHGQRGGARGQRRSGSGGTPDAVGRRRRWLRYGPLSRMHDVRVADRFEVFVENDGATNSWTARYENNAGVQVQRPDAAATLSGS